MRNKKPTKKSIKQAVKDMTYECALEYIRKQSLQYDMNLKKLEGKYQKKLDKYRLEIKRLKKMFEYENEGYKDGYVRIGGIDEAGRGPLAGPVVCACVVLKRDDYIIGVNDSKKLSEKKRERLYDVILDRAVDIGIGKVDNKGIDELNILNATKTAMLKAVENMETKPDLLLIDALKLEQCNIEQRPIVKGDMLSLSIAAASIIAKVTRDRMMKKYADKYPDYGFERNKGYGTKEHINAIKNKGACSLHRKLFVRNYV